MNTCGVILSGGKSSRMGTNKSLLTIENKPVIEWIADELKTCTDRVVLITNEQKQYDFLQLETYGDRYMDKGPLAGLESALYHVDADQFVVAACDTPLVNRQVYNFLLEQLGDYDATVPVFGQQLHPLAGIYKKSAMPIIQHQLNKNNLKVRGFFEHIEVNYIKEFSHIPASTVKNHFFNMNNPAQYEEAKRLWVGL